MSDALARHTPAGCPCYGERPAPSNWALVLGILLVTEDSALPFWSLRLGHSDLIFVENEFRLGQLMFTSPLIHALLAASALGMACALLSVFVVCRRWAFIGEGISHAGLGGADGAGRCLGVSRAAAASL